MRKPKPTMRKPNLSGKRPYEKGGKVGGKKC